MDISSKVAIVGAGCIAYARTHLKPKLQKKHDSDISSLEFIHMRPMYHKIETEVQTISSSLLALVLNVPEHSVFI